MSRLNPKAVSVAALATVVFALHALGWHAHQCESLIDPYRGLLRAFAPFDQALATLGAMLGAAIVPGALFRRSGGYPLIVRAYALALFGLVLAMFSGHSYALSSEVNNPILCKPFERLRSTSGF